MTKEDIDCVQEYLTIMGPPGDRVSQIVNVELLLRKHPPQAVIAFLQQLNKEYSKHLGKMIRDNRTDSRINEIIVKRFRIKMAINTIRHSARQMEARHATQ
jgi:hypothetical protein